MVNKVALVAGAPSGIGESTALELLNRGYTVYVAASVSVTARKPKSRYVASMSARTILTLRWLLTDRAMDALVQRIYGRGWRCATEL